MERSQISPNSPSKKRKTAQVDVDDASTAAAGVVIWDIDDTIVVIQASLKTKREAYQQDLVKVVKEYLTAYLEKEFYFSDTLHMTVVERLQEWDDETVPSPDLPNKIERNLNSLLHLSAKDITSSGSSYSTHLKKQYHSFQNEKVTPTTTDKDSDPKIECNGDEDENEVDVNKPLIGCTSSIYDRLPPGWRTVYEAMESRTFLWTHHAKKVLSHLKKNKVRNMIVTASELAPAIAKLIMWGLFEYFDIKDIYSSANKLKTNVFLHLLKDLGADKNPPQYVGKNCCHKFFFKY